MELNGQVHYYVHGRGRGHVTRSLPVVERLRRDGWSVRIFAGPDAAAHLRGEGIEHDPVESLPPAFSLATAGLLRRRVAAARAARPDFIVSDGDLPSTLAARSLSIGAVAVGHGLVFSHALRPASAPRGPWLRQAAIARSSSVGASRFVAVSFVPLQARRHTTLARPGVAPLARAESPEDDLVLCYFRDANGDAVLEGLVREGLRPVLFSDTPCRVAGVDVRPKSRAGFLSVMARARAMVGSAGSQSISEAVAAKLPFYGLYRGDDDEQLLNVAMLRDAGLGDGAPIDTPDLPRLVRFLAAPPQSAGLWAGPDVADAVSEALAALS